MTPKLIYKIYSGYDGFTPSDIPARLRPGKLLRVSWGHYLDAIEKDQEVWIYFFGPHGFDPGVYAKGYVDRIIRRESKIDIRIREYSPSRPLTKVATGKRLADIVRQRGRQVFVLPEAGRTRPFCTAATSAGSCRLHRCLRCKFWQSLPVIGRRAYHSPRRLLNGFRAFVPAYWVIPNRCFIRPDRLKPSIGRASNMFYRFKFGETSLSFPLALGVWRTLRRRQLDRFDGIVPIPLSPDKKKAGEAHRTALLSRELARLFQTSVVNALALKSSISKRSMLGRGYTRAQFEGRYYGRLKASQRLRHLKRLLLVDDVCTYGSTLSVALDRLLKVNPDCDVVLASDGLMIRKSVVRRKGPLIKKRLRR